jgi:hypothetical protein
MLAREKVANTYLGNGISIPHGLPKNRDLILRTGISVLQVLQDPKTIQQLVHTSDPMMIIERLTRRPEDSA